MVWGTPPFSEFLPSYIVSFEFYAICNSLKVCLSLHILQEYTIIHTHSVSVYNLRRVSEMHSGAGCTVVPLLIIVSILVNMFLESSLCMRWLKNMTNVLWKQRRWYECYNFLSRAESIKGRKAWGTKSISLKVVYKEVWSEC